MVDSLEELSAAFAQWRSTKKHAREVTPADLVERARRGVDAHGEGKVARAAGIDRERLRGTRGQPRKSGPSGATAAPAYSRIDIVAAGGAGRPFAELELPNGVKLRLFSPSPEALGVVSAVCCGTGGGR
ncbi:MAG: hypothetical protein ACT4TC_11450 [Myxococcaceae bacterium]